MQTVREMIPEYKRNLDRLRQRRLDLLREREFEPSCEAYMVSRHGLCERCGKPGLIVHHRKALRPQDMNDPARTLGWSNLELLCHHCHDIEHMAKHSGARCGFDDDGNLLPPFEPRR